MGERKTTFLNVTLSSRPITKIDNLTDNTLNLHQVSKDNAQVHVLAQNFFIDSK